MQRVLRTGMVVVMIVAGIVGGVSAAVTHALTRPALPSTPSAGRAAALSEEVELTIAERETVAVVAMRLRAAGMLRTTLLFRFVVALQGAHAGFQPGTYRLRRTMSVHELVTTLHAGPGTAEDAALPDPAPGPP